MGKDKDRLFDCKVNVKQLHEKDLADSSWDIVLKASSSAILMTISG
jgi:hypothetical protein